MRASRRRTAALVVLSAVEATALLFGPMTHAVPQAHDLPDHLATCAQFVRAIGEGTAYPRWMGDFHDGLGEPTTNFYPPALYYIAAAFTWAAGGDVLWGLFGALVTLSFVGFVGLYRLVRPVAGDAGGVVAVGILALLPYRAFELYGAGLYSAYAGACLLPWALISLERIGRAETGWTPPRALLGWALAYAGILWFNLPLAVLVGYLTLFWIVIELIARRGRTAAPWAIGGCAWGALLAAAYLLPATWELPFVKEPHSDGPPLFESNFLFQVEGSWMNDGQRSLFARMAVLPGAGLAMAGVVSLSILYGRLSRKGAVAAPPSAGTWWRLLLAFGLSSLFLTTPPSAPLWRGLPWLEKVNLPWRLLAPFSVAAAAIVAASAVRTARLGTRGGLARGTVLAVMAASLLVCGSFSLSIATMNEAESGPVSAEKVRAMVPSFCRMEGYFPPRSVKDPRKAAASPPVEVLSGAAHVEILEWSTSGRILRVDARETMTLALRTYYFPGWKAVRVSSGEPLFEEDRAGQEFPIGAEPESGRIVIELPEGVRTVSVGFGSTPPRIAGALVSCAALLAWVVAGAAPRRPRRRPPAPEPACVERLLEKPFAVAEPALA